MAKMNMLARDVRRQAAKAKAVLAAVGQIGEQADSVWLSEALGKLADAAAALDAAGNWFERRELDYHERMAQ